MSYPITLSQPLQTLLTGMLGKDFHALPRTNTSTLTKARQAGFITPDVDHTPDTAYADAHWKLTNVGTAFAAAIAALHARDAENLKILRGY